MQFVPWHLDGLRQLCQKGFLIFILLSPGPLAFLGVVLFHFLLLCHLCHVQEAWEAIRDQWNPSTSCKVTRQLPSFLVGKRGIWESVGLVHLCCNRTFYFFKLSLSITTLYLVFAEYCSTMSCMPQRTYRLLKCP